MLKIKPRFIWAALFLIHALQNVIIGFIVDSEPVTADPYATFGFLYYIGAALSFVAAWLIIFKPTNLFTLIYLILRSSFGLYFGYNFFGSLLYRPTPDILLIIWPWALFLFTSASALIILFKKENALPPEIK